MSIENLKKLIGVKLWAIPTGANNRGKNDPLQITIESVGRKYVKVNGRRYTPVINESHSELRDGCHHDYLVFESKNYLDDYIELQAIMRKAKSFFDHFCRAEHLTLEQWRKIGEIIDSSSKG